LAEVFGDIGDLPLGMGEIDLSRGLGVLGEYEYSIGKVLTRLAPTALVRLSFRRLNPMGNSSFY
jgi:hypothetical protein